MSDWNSDTCCTANWSIRFVTCLIIKCKLTTIFPEAKQEQGVVSIWLYNVQIDHRLSDIKQHHQHKHGQQKPKTSVTETENICDSWKKDQQHITEFKIKYTLKLCSQSFITAGNMSNTLFKIQHTTNNISYFQ